MLIILMIRSTGKLPTYRLFNTMCFRLRFEGERGIEYQGDIALDDISIDGCKTTTFCHTGKRI